MSRRAPEPSRTTALVLLAGAAVAGAATYALVLIVAATAEASAYSEFSVFWSMTVIVALGVFLPLEQETSRLVSTGRLAGPASTVVGSMLRRGLVLALLAGVVSAGLWAVLVGFSSRSLVLFGALVLSYAGYAVQFSVRGLLAGTGRRALYGVVVGSEGVARILLALLVALLLPETAAFAGLVAVAAAASAVPALLALRGERGAQVDAVRTPTGAEVRHGLSRLVLGTIVLQLLLNSPPLLAAALSPGALAGAVLSTVTLARIPIFVYQSLQSMYLPLVAGALRDGDGPRARRVVAVAVGAASVVAVLVVATASLLGPWVMSVAFPAVAAPDAVGIGAIAAAVSLLLVALVASDGLAALGDHAALSAHWLIGAAAGALALLLPVDDVVRSVLPLAVGSVLAGALHLLRIEAIARRHRPR
ncbi:hypothetical protein [Rathayibacter sp. SD072]|uniref:hypothetical protein n=1 Tax=Rathayibacter sp. SD072 TaxID=2781731 RepID=UPI001A9577C6|nr:hypothetical protein [Rathayibacter sp. SD072]MBO0982809.1 hypothetical protein [Rathayibacter sp. SD072]